MSLLLVPPVYKVPGQIAVVACSGVVQSIELQQGIALAEQAGFLIGNHAVLGRQDRYLAGTVAQRFDELAQALLTPEVQIIWAARGGYGAVHLLPWLRQRDDLLHACRTKWLVGFSDVTVLHDLWSQQQVVSLHGANLSQLARWSLEAQQHLFHILQGVTHQAIYPLTPVRATSIPLQAVVVGGNLTVLASMCGLHTYQHWQNVFLFLEEINEAPYRIDRYLSQLVGSGAFQGVRAVVLGQFTACEQLEQIVAVFQAIVPPSVAIYMGLPIGHEDVSWPMPLGAQAQLTPDGAFEWRIRGEFRS